MFPQQSLVVTLLLSQVSPFLFSRTGGVLSHLNFLTHKLPRFPPRNLCFYVMLAVFSLAFAATDTAFCLASISLELTESKILLAALADTRHRTPLISFCTAQLRTLCVARSLAVFCLSTTYVPRPGSFPASGAPWSSAINPSLGRGRVTTTTAKLKLQTHYYVTKGVSKFRHF